MPFAQPSCFHDCPAGLGADQKRLLFLDSSREDKRDVHVPLHMLKNAHQVDLGTQFTDQHIYVINRQAALQALQARPHFAGIQKVGHSLCA